MFWKSFWASFHCVGVSRSCCRVLVRFAISRFCSYKNVIWRFWRLVGGYGIYDARVGGGRFDLFKDYAISG